MDIVSPQLPLFNSDIPMKCCHSCPEDDQWHPATHEFFSRNKTRKDGLQTQCKKCMSKRKEVSRQNRPKIAESEDDAGEKICEKCGRKMIPRHRNRYKKGPHVEYLCSHCKRRRLLELHPDYDKECYQRRLARNPNFAREKTKRDLDRNPHYYRDGRLRQRWGLDGVAYDAMLEAQHGTCAICKQPETRCRRNGKPLPLSIDHNHETGYLRALLCSACNLALGFVNDDVDRLQSMIEYLNQWKETERQ